VKVEDFERHWLAEGNGEKMMEAAELSAALAKPQQLTERQQLRIAQRLSQDVTRGHMPVRRVRRPEQQLPGAMPTGDEEVELTAEHVGRVVWVLVDADDDDPDEGWRTILLVRHCGAHAFDIRFVADNVLVEGADLHSHVAEVWCGSGPGAPWPCPGARRGATDGAPARQLYGDPRRRGGGARQARPAACARARGVPGGAQGRGREHAGARARGEARGGGGDAREPAEARAEAAEADAGAAQKDVERRGG
jgi:hypothetical protein